jgi:glycosyltransferase involved in cell wall biosynthesis
VLGDVGVNTARPRKVSVIVPTCDRPALLREALASIRALEGPDLLFEILVGDDGCAPEVSGIAEHFGAIYLKTSRRGASSARNVCLRAATGDYLAFLDDDDVWLPGNLRSQMALLDSSPLLNAVIGQVVYTDPDLVPKGPPWPTEPPGDGDRMLRKMLGGYYPQLGTALARMRVREEVGEFDETLIGAEDWDWFLRIARRHELGYVEVPGILFRGRLPRSSDALQWKRVNYCRRVFLRHSLASWQIWRSPLEFSKAYTGTLKHLYMYFFEAAVERATGGNRGPALRAVVAALGIFPLRGTYHLISRPPFRRAFWAHRSSKGQ